MRVEKMRRISQNWQKTLLKRAILAHKSVLLIVFFVGDEANRTLESRNKGAFLLRRYLLSVKALLPCCILLSCKALLQSCALLLRNVLLQCYILLPSKVLLQSCVLLSSKALLLMPCCQIARVCSAKQLAKRSFCCLERQSAFVVVSTKERCSPACVIADDCVFAD